MSCVFPGAPDVDAYWRNILGKVDAVTEPPPEAWDVDVYYDPEFADTDKSYVKRGGYLGDADVLRSARLRHPAGLGRRRARPVARAASSRYDALEDAGCADLPAEIRARTGIVLGKGTYLNGGNAIAVQRGLVVEPDAGRAEAAPPRVHRRARSSCSGRS